MFIWRCLNDAIPIRSILSKSNAKVNRHCPFCGFEMETIDSIFFQCELAKAAWFGSALGL